QLVDGYDLKRGAIAMSPCKQLAVGGTATFSVQAGKGWQSTGVQLEPSGSYTIEVTGRFQVNNKPKLWISEPNGVSVQYVRGNRLGCVLGAVMNPSDRKSLSKPILVGNKSQVQKTTGDLYLRINDAMNSLANNSGAATAVITRTR
ncbi:MAG: hypothetical protein AB8G99_26360, partial [Planctomycetaceae bacterium]